MFTTESADEQMSATVRVSVDGVKEQLNNAVSQGSHYYSYSPLPPSMEELSKESYVGK